MTSNLWLHRFAVLLSASTLFLIFVGGLVTSTGSGLAVPDWPLSYGQLFPPMVGGILYEHGHRMVASAVGFLTVVLALWLWRRERRSWVRKLGALAVTTVVCQGILGGITVLFLLPTAVSVSHAGLAQIFFCLTVALAVFTSPRWQAESLLLEDHAPTARVNDAGPGLRVLSSVATAAIYIQILAGALMRHTGSGLAIPDFPLAYGRFVPPFFTRQILIHYFHRAGAVAVTVLVISLAVRVWRSPSTALLRRAAIALVAALALQVFLGAETIWSSRAVLPTTLHVAGGAATLAASLYLTLWIHRLYRAPYRVPLFAAPAGTEPQSRGRAT